MKKILLLLFTITIGNYTFAQANVLTKPNAPDSQVQAYLKKSKERKVAGFIMLGAGALTLFSTKSFLQGETNFDEAGFGVARLLIGTGLITGSILQLSSSSKFKRRAELLISKQKITTVLNSKYQWRVGLAIDLWLLQLIRSLLNCLV